MQGTNHRAASARGKGALPHACPGRAGKLGATSALSAGLQARAVVFLKRHLCLGHLLRAKHNLMESGSSDSCVFDSL